MGDGFYNLGITVCLYIPSVPPLQLKLQICHFNWTSDGHKLFNFLQKLIFFFKESGETVTIVAKHFQLLKDL